MQACAAAVPTPGPDQDEELTLVERRKELKITRSVLRLAGQGPRPPVVQAPGPVLVLPAYTESRSPRHPARLTHAGRPELSVGNASSPSTGDLS